MTLRKLSLVAPIALLAACGGQRTLPPGCEPTDGGPTDIPFSLSPIFVAEEDGGLLPSGVRFGIQFAIGDAGSVSAFLDTGSDCIQILQSALSPAVSAAIVPTGTVPITEMFESGIEATGVVALAPVTFGNLSTPAPIQVFLIQSLACAPGFPCEASAAPLEQDIFDGFEAIVGIGLRGSAIAPGLGSPIPQLAGNPSFIVEAPPFGGDAGTLRIAPSPSEVSAFGIAYLQTDVGGVAIAACIPVWDDSQVPACVDDNTTATQFCGNGVLDTGAPATLVEWQGYTGPEELRRSRASR